MFKQLQILVILALSFNSFGQVSPEDNGSLLWEISGNGLTKKSYLYGTMHVSEKVAFHLSDVFFEKLDEVDAVALETNPEFWLSDMQASKEFTNPLIGVSNGNGFYKSFASFPLPKEELTYILRDHDYYINGILYRNNLTNTNFQEDTYLDMFLYQSAKRSNKEVINLEEFEESYLYASKASQKNNDFQPPAWMMKKLNEKMEYTLLEEAYRDKNLALIDSLNFGLNSAEYLELMFYARNENMVNAMQEVMHSQSIFAGVGAGHLPGKNGMIEMLREKGYTLKPLKGEYTVVGKNRKEEIETTYVKQNLRVSESPDKMFSILTPSDFNNLSTFNLSVYISLDLANAAHLSVFRTPIKDYLNTKKENYNLQRLDSLYFENIPGKILNKKQITIDGYPAWDIKSRTSDGNRKRYIQVLTPLEVLTFIYSGKKEFIATNEDEIVKSISLKTYSDQWETIQPYQGGYQLTLPQLNTISNNNAVSNLNGHPLIEAYDKSTNSYYFLQEKSLDETFILENTNFELERINFDFLDALEVDTMNSKLLTSPLLSHSTEGKINATTTLKLRTFVNGGHYYQLGTTANSIDANRFFNSFKFKAFNYNKPLQTYQDSVLHFSVKTALPPSQFTYDYSYYDENENHFDVKSESRMFGSESKNTILVSMEQFHRYQYYENIDSLWNEFLTELKENSFHVGEPKYSKLKNWEVMDVVLNDTLNTQQIKVKYLQNGGRYYELATLTNQTANDKFVNTFYSTFQPKDTLIGESPFVNKVPFFLEDVNSEQDSIINSAWMSIYNVDFKEENTNDIIELLKTYEFDENQDGYKYGLIHALGEIETKTANDFLINYYHENEGNSDLQIEILDALANQEELNNYQSIIRLLKDDLPLPSSHDSISHLFSSFIKHHKKSKTLIPEVFNFYPIPEYQSNVVQFAKNLIDSSAIQPNDIIAYKDMLLTNAKLEKKRVKSKLINAKQTEYNYDNSMYFNEFFDYVDLLYHFKADDDIEEFLSEVELIDEIDIDLFLIKKKLQNNEKVKSKQLIELVEEDLNNLSSIYHVFYETDKVNKLPKQFTTQQIAKSYLMSFIDFDEETDSIQYITHKKIGFEENNYEIFFFKTKLKNSYNKNIESNWTLSYVYSKVNEEGFLDADFYNSSGIEYYLDSELEKTMKREIDKILYSDKHRVSINYYNHYGY